jgi:hypothetical protein
MFNAIYGKYQWRARQKNLEFSLTKDEFRELTQADCVFCEQKPSQVGRKKNKYNGKYIHNGIDRIDSTKGYVIENCKPCCWQCNKMKSDLTVEEFATHIKKIHDKLKGEEE